MIMTADAAVSPITFCRTLVLAKSALDQPAADGAHIVRLADDAGMSEALRKRELLDGIEQDRAGARRRAVARQPGDLHGRAALDLLALGIVRDLDEGEGAVGAIQTLDHREDRGDAAFVADEQMPIGLAKIGVAARARRFDPLAALGAARPIAGRRSEER